MRMLVAGPGAQAVSQRCLSVDHCNYKAVLIGLVNPLNRLTSVNDGVGVLDISLRLMQLL